MTIVRYQATDALPDGVPAAVVAEPGRVTILVSGALSVTEACAALTPLVTAHAAECWQPSASIA